MPDTKITDDEIVRRYTRGDSLNTIRAGRDRVHRVLRERNIPLRERTDKGRTVTAFSTLQVAASPVVAPVTLPEPVPLYHGGSRLRQKLNRRRWQEQVAS